MPLEPYKNEKHMSPRRSVWHYTCLDAVLAMIETGSILLTRMDHFQDKFEGSITKANMEDLLPLAAGAGARSSMYQQLVPHFPGMEVPRYRDLFTVMTERREAAIRATHANCWSSGEESEALWKLYCRPVPNGVALRSTFGRLRRSVADDETVRVCPVQYRHYHVGEAFDQDLDALLFKRKGFEYEREVRILKFDQAHYNALTADAIPFIIPGRPKFVPPNELAPKVQLAWSLRDCVTVIAVSPYAVKGYDAEVREAVRRIDPKLADRVELSVLSEYRYPVLK
jgi:hypothetical protein